MGFCLTVFILLIAPISDYSYLDATDVSSYEHKSDATVPRSRQKVVRSCMNLAAQMREENTTYVIKKNLDLRGSTLKIPKGCTLFFCGGIISNGTLDLNGCKIEGVGINCKIKNPGNYFYPLSKFLLKTNDEELNHNIVQELISSGVPVIIDYPRLSFNKYISVESNVTVQSASDERVLLEFPNSKGFVWNRRIYSQNNSFRGLNVRSKGDGFDFVNGESEERPYNIYFSRFSDIRVESEEGSCFTAGQGNYGAAGDYCTFDNYFELIEVSAPNGYGFVGLTGNTHHFTKVRCLGCGKAFFYNCSGVFDSCNGTWGTTPTFYLGTRRKKNEAERYTCVFRNCNIEEYKSVLFDCKDVMCYMQIAFEDSSFYISPNDKGVIDFYPFDFAVLLTLRMRNNYFHVYNNGKYDGKHSLMRIGSPSNIIHMDLDKDIQIMDDYAKSYRVSKTGFQLSR